MSKRKHKSEEEGSLKLRGFLGGVKDDTEYMKSFVDDVISTRDDRYL